MDRDTLLFSYPHQQQVAQNQMLVFINGLLTLTLKKKKKEFLANCSFLIEKKVIIRMATFKGEQILENRAAQKQHRFRDADSGSAWLINLHCHDHCRHI